MYGTQAQLDYCFLMLYGSVAMMAMLAGMYLWFRHINIIASHIESPYRLRIWAGAFLLAMAASHIWWVLPGQVWLTDYRLEWILILIALDNMTLVPLVMAMLLRMMQDRQRPLWPIFATIVPTAVIATVGIVKHIPQTEWIMEWYVTFLGFVFVIYMVSAVKQYGRWLRDNYADLEHKEVWQSLLASMFALPLFFTYAYHGGEVYREYMTQVISIIIIVFIVLRVETLQTLDEKTEEETGNSDISFNNKIDELLHNCCEQTQLYLQHDLTLSQLATAIGTNRTYLGAYFAGKGESYNAYINRLRIDYFIQLYQETINNGCIVTAKELSIRSGYHSYSTFSAVFKQRMGQTVTEWTKRYINVNNESR